MKISQALLMLVTLLFCNATCFAALEEEARNVAPFRLATFLNKGLKYYPDRKGHAIGQNYDDCAQKPTYFLQPFSSQGNQWFPLQGQDKLLSFFMSETLSEEAHSEQQTRIEMFLAPDRMPYPSAEKPITYIMLVRLKLRSFFQDRVPEVRRFKSRDGCMVEKSIYRQGENRIMDGGNVHLIYTSSRVGDVTAAAISPYVWVLCPSLIRELDPQDPNSWGSEEHPHASQIPFNDCFSS